MLYSAGVKMVKELQKKVTAEMLSSRNTNITSSVRSVESTASTASAASVDSIKTVGSVPMRGIERSDSDRKRIKDMPREIDPFMIS